MATKVTVIDVDLSINVDQLIAEEATKITEESQSALKIAIDVAKSIQSVKIAHEKEKQKQLDGVGQALADTYKMLEDAGENGVDAKIIMRSVDEYISTPSAFTMRMKTYLKSKDNPYTISKVGKKYIFIPFNEDLPAEG